MGVANDKFGLLPVVNVIVADREVKLRFIATVPVTVLVESLTCKLEIQVASAFVSLSIAFIWIS